MNEYWNGEPMMRIGVSNRRGTILLVEDEAFVREVTSEILRAEGYGLWTATNSAEAEQIFNRHEEEIDLLLTDVVLPGKTGRVLATEMRRKNPRIRVLYVTGYAEQMKALQGSGEECLAKPFSSEVLLGRLKGVMAPRELRLEGRETMRVCAGA